MRKFLKYGLLLLTKLFRLLKKVDSTSLIQLLLFCLLLIISLLSIKYYLPKEDKELNKRIKSDSINIKIKVDADKLLFEINANRKTTYYEITQIPNKEYVKGYSGSYFIIDLKDAVSQTILLFPAGEYTYSENEWRFVKALDNVKSIIWSGILKNTDFKIFIEGQADSNGNTSFQRESDTKYVFHSIQYCPTYKSENSSRICYDSNRSTKIFSKSLHNSDLPLLRAAYLNELLLIYGHIPTPVILEGNVENKNGEIYRNGKIILFIAEK